MANRYWVGGTGNWDETTTKWSATSGGAGGASVPTLSDDVFFNSASNATAYVVTLLTAPICRSVSVVGPASGNVTIAGSAAWSIYGSFTLAATGVTWTNTSGLTFAATTTGFTITTNGIALATGASAITLNGAGGGWTLGSALTNSGAFTFVQGSFATANFSLTTTGNFSSVSALTRSLTLGSSAISCLAWNALGATNLTVNAGTSTITVTSAAGTFNGGSLTYYNVTRASSAAATIQVGDANNTFNSISVTNASGYGTLLFVGNQTIGTLTANGNALIAPIRIISSVIGTQVTLTVASFVTNGFINFRDINFAGAALPITVSTGGDLGNNSNITLSTPKTIYWSLVAGGNWTATAWATTSGGVPATANFPLAQDTIIIENTGLNSGATITMDFGSFIGNMSMSTRTLPMTWAIGSQAVQNYGNLTLSSAVTTTATTGSLNFLGFNKTQTITSASVSFASSLTVNSPTLTVALADPLTTTATFTLTFGTLNLANNILSCWVFNTNNTNTRAITFGTGQINLTGNAGTIWISDVGTNLSYTGSPNVYCTYSGSTGTRSIQGTATATATETNVFNFFVNAGSDSVTVIGARRYRTLDFTGFSGTLTAWVTSMGIYGDFVASSTMTITPNTIPLVFLATLITQKITTNTKTLSFPVYASNNLQLQDALTIDPAYAFTLAIGTLDVNGKTLTSGTFSSTGSIVRSIAFNGGTMTVSGSNFTTTGSNFTTTGSGTINMTLATSKTFAGGGFNYPTLNQGGLGTLIITGANTFKNITNSVQPCTITFPASSTTIVNDFQVSGTAGNLVTLNSSTPGTKFTLNYVNL